MGLFGKSKYEKGNAAFLKNDFALAKTLWTEGVDKGETDCMLALGSMYEKGKGVETDAAKAFAYYEMAARKKAKFGYFYVGRCFLYGIGVVPDEAKGREYLNLAFSKGVAFARKELQKYEAERKAGTSGTTGNHAAHVAGQDSAPKLRGNSSADNNGKNTATGQCAASTHVDSLGAYEKAKAYAAGDGVPQDFTKAIYWLRIAADQGNARAMKELADCYLGGAGIDKDERKAFDFYRKAAEAGNLDAMYMMAAFYLNGHLVATDLPEGVRWLKIAADKGHCKAQVMLGNMYHTGQGVAKDMKEAFRYLSAAADQRDPSAKLMLGHFYYYGLGTEKNYSRAFTNLIDAYDGGEKTASLLLGFYYLNHSDHKAKDYERAFFYLKEAMSLGLPDAESNVAYCYAKGLGVKKNRQEAMRLYMRVYENASKELDERAAAACNIGIILLANEGVKRDVIRATEYLGNAKNAGSSLALYYLGMLYYDGASQDGRKVVERDLNRAYILLKAAAQGGISDARKYLTSDLSAIIPRSTLKAQGIVGEFLSELSSGLIDSFADNISF